MRQQNSTLAVVNVTGHGDIAMALEEMKLGAVDFLQKPIAATPLIEALEHWSTGALEHWSTGALHYPFSTLSHANGNSFSAR
ncbi:response regulator [Serratia quinivorans]|uniref:response regulator n=1 Tax=Serratia quinivorans TaxID=137545 RepID=UPI003F969129